MERHEFLIGSPAERPPAELLAKLATLFQETRELQAAYLFQMSQSNQTSNVIGLRFATEPPVPRMREIMAAIGERVRSSLPPDRFIDFMSLSSAQLAQQAERFGECIFRVQRTPS